MPIEFKPIAAPDFSKTLEALSKAGDSYKDVFKGLQTTLDGVQTNVVNRNNATLQDYINKAATPEELQGADFQVGLQNLKDSMDKNFSALDVNKYADTRVDTLRQRANDIFNAQKAQAEYGQLQKDWKTKNASQNAAMALLANPAVTQEKVMGQFPDADPVLVSNFANTLLKSRNEALDRAANIYIQNNPDKPLPPELQGADVNAGMKLMGDLAFQKAQIRASNATATKSEVDAAGQRIVNDAQRILSGQLFGNGNDPTGNNAPKVSLGNIDLSNVTLTDATRKDIKDSVEKNIGFLGKIQPIVVASAQKYNLPAELLWAVAHVESAFDPAAKSPVGAGGLMQIIPETAKRFGVTDVNDPAQAIPAAAKYLSFLLKRYKGDAVKAIAGYNAGEGNVDKYEGVPPFKETQAYVPKVLGRMRFFAEQNGTLTSLGGSNINPAGIGIASNGTFIYNGTPKAGGGGGGGGSSGGSGSGGGGASGEGAAIGHRPWESTLEGLKYKYAQALSERSFGTAEGQKTAVYTPRFRSQEELSKNYKNKYSIGQNNYVPSIIKSAREIPDFLELPPEDQMHILDTALSTTEMKRWRRDFDAQPSEEYRKMIRKLVDERNQLAKIKAVNDLKATNRLYVTQVAQAGDMRPVEAGRYLGMSDYTLQQIGVLDKDGNPASLPATWGQAAAPGTPPGATAGTTPGTPPGATAGTTPDAAAGVAAIKEAVIKDALGYYRGSSLTTDQMSANGRLMSERQNQLLKGNFEGEPALAKDIAALDAKIASLKKQPGTLSQINELMLVREGLIQRTYDGLQIARTKTYSELTKALKSKRDAEAKKLQDKLDAENANIERIKVASKTPADKPIPKLPVVSAGSSEPKPKEVLSEDQLQEYANGNKRHVVTFFRRLFPDPTSSDTVNWFQKAIEVERFLNSVGKYEDARKVSDYTNKTLNAMFSKDNVAQDAANKALEARRRAADAAGKAVKANTQDIKLKEAYEYMKKQGIK